MIASLRILLLTTFTIVAAAAATGRTQPSPPTALTVAGRSNATPWVAAAGEMVAAVWGATSAGKTDVFVAVSRDGGTRFDPPIQVNTIAGEARLGGELPPRVALRPGTSGAEPEVVVLWTSRGDTTDLKVARSQDGGRSFRAPVTLQSGAVGDRGWAALALDSRGTAHAIWLDHRELAVSRAAPSSAAHQAPHDGVAMALKSSLFHASTSGPSAAPRAITPGVCYCCKTALAVADDGTIYAAWRHVYAGNMRDIAMTVSRDGGRSFSPPVRISEDGWSIDGCPDDGPALAIDRSGTVHIVWPTVIPGAEPQGAIFHTTTRDGRRFAPRERIPTRGGPKPSHPQIVTDDAGRIVVAWDEAVDGRRMAFVRDVTPRQDGSPALGDLIALTPDGVSSYPVLAASRKGLVVVWSTGGAASRVESRLLGVGGPAR